jgi:NAD(P)-dependent dehydrogenase (short-subunit alcohol dehydrogenase family)
METMKDKIVVVSGAAGYLGRVVVKTFLAHGASVCALDHREGRIIAMDLDADLPGKLFIFDNYDLADREVVPQLSDAVHDRVGKVDVIINTVGGFTMGERVFEISEATWQLMMDLNVMSFLNLSRAFVPDLLEKGAGKVVSVGSGASLKGSARTGAYAAAKAALLRLTESMAAELSPNGIQVNCVMPGTIDTPKNREEMPNADISKWVKPGKIAEVILFLASPEADAITGSAIPVFGHP